MKIAFLLPYYEGRNHSPFLGVGYLSQTLKGKGFSTCILDEDALVFFNDQKGERNPLGASRRFLFDHLQGFQPDVLALSISTANYQRSLDLLRFLRKKFPGVFIMVGGPHITSSWECFREFHSQLFEVAVIGEGEETVSEICSRLRDGSDWRGAKGSIPSRGPEVPFSPRPLIRDLDSLPFPDRDGFFAALPGSEVPVLQEHYHRVFYSHLPGFRGKPYTRIVASRGCDFSCDFCSPSACWKDPETGRPERRLRKPEKIADEIEALVSTGHQAFYFDDPTFPFLSQPDFIHRFIAELKERGLGISWAAPTRSDELSEEMLVSLSRSGFSYTYFGLETPREDRLLGMGKPTDLTHSLDVLKHCEELGIHCDVSFQVGLPGDSFETIIRDIQWLERHHLQKKSFFSLAAIWPETPLAKKYDLLSRDFEPSADKKRLETRGLFYFSPGDQRIERYFSNCSGTFHFIDVETAIKVKYYLIDAGFIKRFEKMEGVAEFSIHSD